jgi:UDP-glucose 4-epimerase
VVIFDRIESPDLQKSQKMVVGDMLDQQKVRETIKGADCVYHFAGITDIKIAKNNPIDTVKYNVLGTVYILDACREFKIKRIIHASIIYVYSKHGSFYRSSKQSCELFIEK